jgi:uncharacterized membrane protein YhaH (DUF805 family)
MPWTQYLFSFQGRIGRGGFWLFFFVVQFANQVAYLMIASAIMLLWNGSLDVDQAGTLETVTLTILALPFVPIAFISPFAIWAKRLHDRNKSGWWQIVYLPSFALFATAMELHDDHLVSDPLYYLSVAIAAIGYAVLIWIAIEAAFIRGTRGENRFGPDPLEASS